MDSDSAKSELTLILTKADLGKIPPELRVATGNDDKVMLFLRRVSDPDATTKVLLGFITTSESKPIVEAMKMTQGLIRKRYDIDVAFRIKGQLLSVGTEVEFVRPSEVAPD